MGADVTEQFYVFQLKEAEVDEKTLLGPTYRLVVNIYDEDGRWTARTAHLAIELAARQTGRDDIYAAVPADGMVVERWPLGIAEMAHEAPH
jgi:hypothetical protein